MEYHEKVLWLKQYRDACRKKEVAWQKVEQCRAASENCTSCWSLAPGGGGTGDKMQRDAERNIEAFQSYQAAFAESAVAYRRVEKAIRNAGTVEDYMLLYQRFIGLEAISNMAKAWGIKYCGIKSKLRRTIEGLTLNP